ncbi:MAG TPA: nuclear transport factor 2 family protein [Cyclobacteriaceae bacterium]|nr:nuclear transport factor 2 family protein [Cyclobacteriaceae bacterium]
MKKALFVIVTAITLLTGKTFAQSLPGPLQSLVDAERGFAAKSKESNTRQAFLDNLAPDAILLDNGKEVNGIESWTAKPVGNGLLFWEPVYADIASSNDFGWTTGPYWVYKNRSDTVPAFGGFFSTVWGKQPDGKWKVLFDLGGGIPPKEKLNLTTSSIALKPKKRIDKETELKNLLEFDKKYVARLNASGRSFDISFYSKEGRAHRGGRLPAVGIENVSALDETGRKYEFTPLSGRIASSGDMAYTYGTGKVTVSKDGAETRVVPFSTFRIWKKEDGKNWKIVLDVLGQ